MPRHRANKIMVRRLVAAALLSVSVLAGTSAAQTNSGISFEELSFAESLALDQLGKLGGSIASAMHSSILDGTTIVEFVNLPPDIKGQSYENGGGPDVDLILISRKYMHLAGAACVHEGLHLLAGHKAGALLTWKQWSLLAGVDMNDPAAVEAAMAQYLAYAKNYACEELAACCATLEAMAGADPIVDCADLEAARADAETWHHACELGPGVQGPTQGPLGCPNLSNAEIMEIPCAE